MFAGLRNRLAKPIKPSKPSQPKFEEPLSEVVCSGAALVFDSLEAELLPVLGLAESVLGAELAPVIGSLEVPPVLEVPELVLSLEVELLGAVVAPEVMPLLPLSEEELLGVVLLLVVGLIFGSDVLPLPVLEPLEVVLV